MKMSWKKEDFYVRKEFNSHRICLEDQHGCCFIVLRHQYGRRDVMFKYLAPALERDFKYLLFDTPLPQLKPALSHSLFFKGHLYSFPRVYQGSLSSSKTRSFESLSLPFLLAGWQMRGGIFFGMDCLHFSAQGHAAAALALWETWYCII